jgi:hypothetical protein
MGKAEYIRKRAAFRKKNKNGNFDRHLIELAKKTKAKAK